jgi:hypothetical protein
MSTHNMYWLGTCEDLVNHNTWVPCTLLHCNERNISMPTYNCQCKEATTVNTAHACLQSHYWSTPAFFGDATGSGTHHMQSSKCSSYTRDWRRCNVLHHLLQSPSSTHHVTHDSIHATTNSTMHTPPSCLRAMLATCTMSMQWWWFFSPCTTSKHLPQPSMVSQTQANAIVVVDPIEPLCCMGPQSPIHAHSNTIVSCWKLAHLPLWKNNKFNISMPTKWFPVEQRPHSF